MPLSFTVRVKQGLALNQLRLSLGSSRLTDEEIRALHGHEPILYREDRPVPPSGPPAPAVFKAIILLLTFVAAPALE